MIYFILFLRMSNATKDDAGNTGKAAGKCFSDSSNHNFWTTSTVMPE